MISVDIKYLLKESKNDQGWGAEIFKMPWTPYVTETYLTGISCEKGMVSKGIVQVDIPEQTCSDCTGYSLTSIP